MIGRKILWIALALGLSATCPVLNAQTDLVLGPKEWGQSIGDLQISLYLASDKTDRFGIPDVGLAIRNLGSSPQKVALGGGCQAPTVPGVKTADVRLVLRDEMGRSQQLWDVPGPPLIGRCAGAVGIFTLDLATGTTSTVPIDLDCYYVKPTFKYAWAGGGTYSLRAEFELHDVPGLISFGPLNGHTIESNELRVHFAANVASVRCFSSGAEVPCWLFQAPPANNQIVEANRQAWGEPVNGLQMSISYDAAATAPDGAMRLIVTFRNLAPERLTLLPGMLADCWSERPSRTSFIVLNLTDSEGHPHRHLPYWGDGPPYGGTCSGPGPIKPFVTLLPAGASLSLPLDLGKYLDLSDSKQYAEARFSAGTYALQLLLTNVPSSEGPPPIRAWAGTVISNTLQVSFDKEFAAPLGDCPQCN